MGELTQQRLKELLEYDEDTGEFTWLISLSNRGVIGQAVGSTRDDDYRVTSIYGKPYLMHRLAFLYMTGEFPKLWIDHINKDPSDNRWINLRECSPSQNNHNRALQRQNNSGYKGIGWLPKIQKWRARITINGKEIHLGVYIDIRDAINNWNKAAVEHHKEFATIQQYKG